MRDFNYRNQVILNNTNYLAWRERITKILRAERVFSSIEQDPRLFINNIANGKAKEIINRLLDKKHKLLVQDCDSAKAIWTKLETTYNENKKQALQLKAKRILKKLENYRMSESADPSATAKTMIRILSKFEEMGIKVAEDESITYVRNTLSQKFTPFEDLWTVISKGGGKLDTFYALISAADSLSKNLSGNGLKKPKNPDGVELELTKISAEAEAEIPPAKKARVEEKKDDYKKCEKEKPPQKENNRDKRERRYSSNTDVPKYHDKRRHSSTSRSNFSSSFNSDKKRVESASKPTSSSPASSAPSTSTSTSTSTFTSNSTSTSTSTTATAPVTPVTSTPLTSTSSTSTSKNSDPRRRSSESWDCFVNTDQAQPPSSGTRNEAGTLATKVIESSNAIKISGKEVTKSPIKVSRIINNVPTSSAVIVKQTNSAGVSTNVPAISLNNSRSLTKVSESALNAGISAHFLSPHQFNAAQNKVGAKKTLASGKESSNQAATLTANDKKDNETPIKLVRRKISGPGSSTDENSTTTTVISTTTIWDLFQLKPGYNSSYVKDKDLLQEFEEYPQKVHRAPSTQDPDFTLETYGKGVIVTTRGKFTAFYAKGLNVNYLSPSALNEQQSSQAQPNPFYDQKITSMIEKDDNIVRLEIIVNKTT